MSKYNPKQVSISKGNGKVDVIGIASSEDMERALNDKLDVDGNATNTTVDFTEATTLATLSSGEILATAFSKIKKAITEFINHKNSTSNPHSVTKLQVGLGNCDNTSDANKPISTATQTALNGKAPTSHRSTTTVYGKGDESYYGHVKLSDSVSTIGGASAGIAATPSAVKIAYDKAVEAYNLADGIDVTNSATYVVTTQLQLNNVMKSLPSTGGKIILREGNFTLPDSISNKYIIFEGMGQDVTTLKHYNGFTNKITIEFHNMTIKLYNNVSNSSSGSNGNDKASLIFTNCKVSDLDDVEIYNGTGDLTFINCNTDLAGLTVNGDCISGIANARRVCFIGGRVNLNSGSTYQQGFDCNLIYKCDEFQFADVEIVVSGVNRANIVYAPDGIGGFEGCHIYLAGGNHSICHYSSNGGVGGAFVGNYVEMYGSYMRFGTITGNIFTQKVAGSSSANKMVLQCPTNMMGNNFRGLAVYVDCQNNKCNISYNMVDSGITVGNNASGGSAVGNLTY